MVSKSDRQVSEWETPPQIDLGTGQPVTGGTGQSEHRTGTSDSVDFQSRVCIPKTVSEEGEKITYGRVDFVGMGGNLIVSIECQEYHHKSKTYDVRCEVARSFKIVTTNRCSDRD